MMKPYLFVILFSGLILNSCALFSDDPIAELENEIETIKNIESNELKEKRAKQLIDSLRAQDQIPFTKGNTAYFFYYGEADQVEWNGDFNSWGQDRQNTISAKRISGTDLWYADSSFPADARLDYKITLNGSKWILDPLNPHVQYSGFGPNSELRMPEWEEDNSSKKLPAAPSGNMSDEKIIDSKSLQYQISYKVYTPAGYEDLEDLPVIYVTDGHEYADEKLGRMPVIADNLIYKKKIVPLIIVFVSPLDPADETTNRRTDEFGMNEEYLKFYTMELLPLIDEEYKVAAKSSERAIMGASLGGLNAAYFGFSEESLFGKIALQAPAFWYNEEIYELVRNSDKKPDAIFMSAGTIGDNTVETRKMKKIFSTKDLELTYFEVNQGHSWGTWNEQLDDILILFFGS